MKKFDERVGSSKKFVRTLKRGPLVVNFIKNIKNSYKGRTLVVNLSTTPKCPLVNENFRDRGPLRILIEIVTVSALLKCTLLYYYSTRYANND